MSTATAETPAATAWIPCKLACELLGTYPQKFKALVADGVVRSRVIPGSQPRYALADVQALADRAIRSHAGHA